jgi:hypothetical protein
VLGAVTILGLGYYYRTMAITHAERVNIFKARGDQSAYLAEAKLLYDNWTGKNDPPILQPRNRMPLYPAYLAARYDPQWSDQEFFEHGKRHNIDLSLALLIVLAIVITRHLPLLAAANLTLIIAFGYFVFKAGYVQSELLFYTLHFLTFVAFWHFLETDSRVGTMLWAICGGVLAALAHLTKAAMLPFVALCILACATDAALRVGRTQQAAGAAWRLAGCLLLAAAFLGTLLPYISNSKRVHGQYFYNLNTSALIWYDNYPQASVAILDYGADGWPPGRRSDRPSPTKYWREHSVGQIVARLQHGFQDMIVASYRTYWYVKFVMLFLLGAMFLAASRRDVFRQLIQRHAALAAFVSLYAIVYLPAVAFYEPISGTGTTRFLLAHVAPLLFLLSRFVQSPAFAADRWRIGRLTVGVEHMQVLVLLTIGLDLTFTLWPRVMTTYGGF